MPRTILKIGLVGLLILAACAPAGPALKIEPDSASVEVGELVTVSVKAEQIANLTAVELHLSFDPTLVEVVEIKDGGWLRADFVIQKTFDNAAGSLDYAIAQIGGAPASGSGALMEVVFRAKASGEAEIRFRGTPAAPSGALLADPDGKAIEVGLQVGSLEVK